MQAPLSYRNGIPFFYDKSELEFRLDVYERYDEMVVRQSALHLADELWGGYPFREILDFTQGHYPEVPQTILELGCGVGRWIGTLAQQFPNAACWGVDFSYQMLKRAREHWVLGKTSTLDWTNKGFPTAVHCPGHQVSNLQFGLAKAEHLPFDEASQDLIVQSFLLDRVDHPAEAIKEAKRLLSSAGRLILISPLNFQQAAHWKSFYPPEKLKTHLKRIGFELLEWQTELELSEPLDARGNVVQWKGLGLVAKHK
ncbi:MAG: methyltransferase domain-containing protein [Bacteroidota bacterium]